MKLEMNLQGLDGVLATLRSLPPEVVSKRGGPVKLALAKGARVIRDEARRNLERVTSTPGKTGINYGTGFSPRQLIVRRRPMPGGQNGERYVLTVRPATHPNGNVYRRGKRIAANDVTFMLEYGTANQPAEPWLRPAFEAKKEQAMAVVIQDLKRRVDLVVAKLAAQNKGR